MLIPFFWAFSLICCIVMGGVAHFLQHVIDQAFHKIALGLRGQPCRASRVCFRWGCTHPSVALVQMMRFGWWFGNSKDSISKRNLIWFRWWLGFHWFSGCVLWEGCWNQGLGNNVRDCRKSFGQLWAIIVARNYCRWVVCWLMLALENRAEGCQWSGCGQMRSLFCYSISWPVPFL